ncbi:hypothetical protein CAPTEDRAFT_199920 [Capitella teleta]|uniref:N-acetyltransferase domain-containing protein n=1 Tax=Capitella teleta TaxID=283909 RepID=R7UDG6_CAPTE|nr:hypothetical protein CAPTEDRAFT_199920 [Capitella teleta]|eukprot:ELU04019.1 hypothetical protein CAPTEDRAFT_199920 [Capitella teleta]
MTSTLQSIEVAGLQLHLRNLRKADLDQLNEMIQELSWGVTTGDINCHFKVYPNSFYGLFTSNGQLMSHIAVFPEAPGKKFIGLFITKAEFRGRGIGAKLFQFVRNLHQECNMCLSAIPKVTKWYKKQGFLDSNNLAVTFANVGQFYPKRDPSLSDQIIVKEISDGGRIALIAEFDRNICKVDPEPRLE